MSLCLFACLPGWLSVCLSVYLYVICIDRSAISRFETQPGTQQPRPGMQQQQQQQQMAQVDCAGAVEGWKNGGYMWNPPSGKLT